jgi:antitoxin (DNA-binding transcriptional repressor) of toxin-antitoxin stability system
MRVKTGELKSRLSHYLRHVRETGEEIEVCVRETPVAYIRRAQENPEDAAVRADQRALEAAFRSVGLRLDPGLSLPPPGGHATSLPGRRPRPSLAGDGRGEIDTVSELRGQRDW